jgi:hypothetical protein
VFSGDEIVATEVPIDHGIVVDDVTGQPMTNDETGEPLTGD